MRSILPLRWGGPMPGLRRGSRPLYPFTPCRANVRIRGKHVHWRDGLAKGWLGSRPLPGLFPIRNPQTLSLQVASLACGAVSLRLITDGPAECALRLPPAVGSGMPKCAVLPWRSGIQGIRRTRKSHQPPPRRWQGRPGRIRTPGLRPSRPALCVANPLSYGP